MNSTGNVVTTIADVILLTVDFKTFYVGYVERCRQRLNEIFFTQLILFHPSHVEMPDKAGSSAVYTPTP